MADRYLRARHRLADPGSRSPADVEAALPDEVRRRLLLVRAALPDGGPPAGQAGPARSPGAPTDVRRRRPAWPPWRAWLGDRVPTTLRGAALSPSRSAVAGLALLLAAAVALAAALFWLDRPHVAPAPRPGRTAAVVVAAPSPTAAGSAGSPQATVVVHVVGAVRRPGVVELPGGSRVDDAVAAAGGPGAHADLGSVNLARPLVDGEQVVVLRRGQAAVAPVGSTWAPDGTAGGPGSPGVPVDLNSATLEQLDGLPGVGPVLARRIIDWRTRNGRFTSVHELTEVSGIGERTFAELAALVRV